MTPCFRVPPQAHFDLSVDSRLSRLMDGSWMPSTRVIFLPYRRESVVMRISWCSRAMSSQTQISLGRPHVSQIKQHLRPTGCSSLLGLRVQAELDLAFDGQDAGDLAPEGADLARAGGRAAHGLDTAFLHQLALELHEAGLAVVDGQTAHFGGGQH